MGLAAFNRARKLLRVAEQNEVETKALHDMTDEELLRVAEQNEVDISKCTTREKVIAKLEKVMM